MSTEQMRNSFEKMRGHGGLAKWPGGNYVSEMTQSMWSAYQKAWQASREELVVELSADLPCDGYSDAAMHNWCRNEMKSQIAEIIRAAGITVKEG
ncbi:hypothetical protein [Pectobacterium carotovorum]|uniref:hypothetical protein n=1 Tax=Pectobacterium carotovorum TaxID=554 RepID=UPI002080C09D|nr:hypothetical protein [Pectobacterium carotovorum]GKV89307.1 hypothetical protein PEC301619_12890 [Pectobacterium carotovorum subsp. carotovorum]